MKILVLLIILSKFETIVARRHFFFYNLILIISTSIFFLQPFAIHAKIPDSIHGEYPSNYFQFWFLYESESRRGQNYYFFRPFFSSYKEYETAYSQNTVLFPIYYKEKTNYWYTWSVLFFFTGVGFYHEDSGEDEDFITPLLFWGKSDGNDNKDNYWGIFPLYGHLNGKLSYEEVHFALFPLYASWKRRDYKAHGILWPLIMWGRGNSRDDIRIFPLYSKKEHDGKYYQYSLLWPFFQWGRKFMDKREPVNYVMFFPIYQYKSSDYGNMKSVSFLWFPFLGSLVSFGYDERTSGEEINFLYFIFQYAKNNNPDFRKFILFPFYGNYHFASRRTSFITPFYINLSTNSYHVKSSNHYVFPFFFHSYSHYPELKRDKSYIKLWPLFRYKKDEEGGKEWNLFTLFPIHSDELDKTWDPIISIFEYKNIGNGERYFSFLFRLYSQRWNDESFSIFIPFLTDYESKNGSYKWNFLYGFLGFEKQEDLKRYRFLWFLRI